MEKTFLVLALSLSAIVSNANATEFDSEASLLSGNPLEFTAPVVYDMTTLTQAGAGTIVYDESLGGFFGLTTGGNPSSSASWRQMGSTSSSGNVSSQGSAERVERGAITNNGTAAIGSQSGAWLNNVSRSATGIVTLNFQTSPAQWASAPTCICVSYGTTNNVRLCTVNSTSTSSTTIQTFDDSNTARDVDFNVICQGAH